MECFNLNTALANRLYNSTILLTLSGLFAAFYWNMSDVKDSTKGVTGHDRHLFDAFLYRFKLGKSLPPSVLKGRSLN